MAFETDNIDRLLEEVTNFFEKSTLAPSKIDLRPKMAPQLSSNFQAPLKGTWYSSGGFDLTSMRPNGRKGHAGVDMRAPGGTPVYPMAPGVVSSVGVDPLGGNVVNIRHANGIRSYYAHLSTVKVFKNEQVDNDTVIGTVGDTGNAKGTHPHVHFQVWSNNQIQDPAKYFNVPKYTNLNAEEKRQGPWLSEEAKHEAQAFNMREHIEGRKTLASAQVANLVTCAEEFYNLVNNF